MRIEPGMVAVVQSDNFAGVRVGVIKRIHDHDGKTIVVVSGKYGNTYSLENIVSTSDITDLFSYRDVSEEFMSVFIPERTGIPVLTQYSNQEQIDSDIVVDRWDDLYMGTTHFYKRFVLPWMQYKGSR